MHNDDGGRAFDGRGGVLAEYGEASLNRNISICGIVTGFI
tara:strand:- start:595 stop:714 length:120 start_codon:yes stop_codon:yes gene_type:complete